MTAHPPHTSIEPRVAKVETEIEALGKDISSLTMDVRSLAGTVRTQGDTAAEQFRQLSVLVTNAAAPRKTDWGVFVSGVGLILTIGAAAMSPLYLRVGDLIDAHRTVTEQVRQFSAQSVRFDDLRGDFQELQKAFSAHEKIPMHPMGQTRTNMLEQMVNADLTGIRAQLRELDGKLQKEYELANANTRTAFDALQREFDIVRRDGSPVTRERLTRIETQMAETKNK